MIRKNNRGFSLIEILAVILITTTVIIPLLISLTGNYEVNTRLIRRSAASLVTVSAIQGFQNMYFADIEDRILTLYEDLDPDNASAEDFFLTYFYDPVEYDDEELEISKGNCTPLRDSNFPPIERPVRTIRYASNKETCKAIFSIKAINLDFGPDEYKAYITPFSLTPDQRSSFIEQLEASDVPLKVQQEFLQIIPDESGPRTDILRITVWIRYGDRPGDTIVRSSLLSSEESVRDE